MLVRLAELLPAAIKVCIVVDRGFGDQKLYKMLTEELHFDYVTRTWSKPGAWPPAAQIMSSLLSGVIGYG